MTEKKLSGRRFLVLVAVVFGTSLGVGLVFSLEKTRFSSRLSVSGGSVLSQAEVKKTDSLSSEPDKGIAGREVLVREKKSLDFDLVSWETTAEKTIFRLAKALEQNEPSLVYDFLGTDLREMFTREDFLRSLLPSSQITQVEIIDGPKVSGVWSELVIELVLEDGSFHRYLVVFHFESGNWKLFGTEEAG